MEVREFIAVLKNGRPPHIWFLTQLRLGYVHCSLPVLESRHICFDLVSRLFGVFVNGTIGYSQVHDEDLGTLSEECFDNGLSEA